MVKYKSNRGIAQLVARLSGGQEVVSSSLATPTKSRLTKVNLLFYYVKLYFQVQHFDKKRFI